MTRTARATFPRAVQKDRHENRSGLDPNMRKGGAGGHNWGNFADEQDLETTALDDENMETEDLKRGQDVLEDQELRSAASPVSSKPSLSRSSSNEEDAAEARKMRKNMLKQKDIDLSAIARTSVAASTSPPRVDGLLRGPGRDGRQLPISSTTGI